MKRILLKVMLTLLVFIIALATANATHTLGGEIRYWVVTGTTYAVEIRYYTDLNSPADRPELPLDFGDGVVDTVPRTTVVDFPAGGSCGPVRLSTYQIAHTYPGPGTYSIRFEDTNRNSGIINIPNSVLQPFCVSALLVIDPVLGWNNSILFDTLQTRTFQNWNTLVHEPDANDPDGDSLSFELATPWGLSCQPITGYVLPTGINLAWLDPNTGRYLWDYPAMLGEYVVAIKGSEWRNGQLIGQVTRDMTICVSELATSIAEVAPTDDVTHASISDGSLRLTNRATTPVLAEFVAMTGALQAHVQLPPGEHVLDITSWASGMYVLRTTASDGRTHLSRLVKR